MTTETIAASKGITDAVGAGIRLIRRLVDINLGLVGLQALSAGFLMSGYARALAVHAIVAVALQLGSLIQAVAAVVSGGGACTRLGCRREYRPVRDCVFFRSDSATESRTGCTCQSGSASSAG
jgi:hypothetical protein